MQLYLDSFGAYLCVKNEMFCLRTKQSGGEASFPIREVNAILITKGVSLSSDAMLLALKNDIPLLLIDSIGHPVGQLWSGYYGSIATIRKNQAIFVQSEKGWNWMRQILINKIKAQKSTLESINEFQIGNDNFKRKWRSAMVGMQEAITKFERFEVENNEKTAEKFRGWEATASRYYWATFSASLDLMWQFKTRSYRPAEDEFNALLNYLYGILYVQVEVALMKAGIDPTMGILHVDRNSRPTFVYDVIEQYRHWAESVAYNICQKNLVSISAFEEKEGAGFWIIDSAAKAIIAQQFMAYLDEKIELNGKLRKRNTHIIIDAQQLATLLKNL